MFSFCLPLLAKFCDNYYTRLSLNDYAVSHVVFFWFSYQQHLCITLPLFLLYCMLCFVRELYCKKKKGFWLLLEDGYIWINTLNCLSVYYVSFIIPLWVVIVDSMIHCIKDLVTILLIWLLSSALIGCFTKAPPHTSTRIVVSPKIKDGDRTRVNWTSHRGSKI